jgi:hypothetical protein
VSPSVHRKALGGQLEFSLIVIKGTAYQAPAKGLNMPLA